MTPSPLSRSLRWIRDTSNDPSRRNLVITVGAGVLVQIMLAVTGPLLVRLLGPAGRGDLAALMLWPSVLVLVGGLGIPAALTYYISGGAPRRETIRRGLTFAAGQVVVLTSIQVLIVFALFADRGPEVRDAALLTIAVIPGLLAQQYGLGVLQARSDLRPFNFFQLLPIALYAIAVVVLFVSSSGIWLVALSWVTASTIVGFANLAYAIRRSRASAASQGDAPSGKSLLSFGVRGIVGVNSTTDIIRPDQIALVIFLAPRALGLYLVGLAFTNLPYFIAKAVGLVAFPAVAREADAEVARQVAWRYLWIIVGFASVLVLVLALSVSTLIPLFFGPGVEEAVELSYILLGGAFFTAVRRVLAECMRGRGQPGAGTIAEGVAVAWLLAALAVLLPTVGLTGVAIALASSQVASLVVLVAIAVHRGELRIGEGMAALPLRGGRFG